MDKYITNCCTRVGAYAVGVPWQQHLAGRLNSSAYVGPYNTSRVSRTVSHADLVGRRNTLRQYHTAFLLRKTKQTGHIQV